MPVDALNLFDIDVAGFEVAIVWTACIMAGAVAGLFLNVFSVETLRRLARRREDAHDVCLLAESVRTIGI